MQYVSTYFNIKISINALNMDYCYKIYNTM